MPVRLIASTMQFSGLGSVTKTPKSVQKGRAKVKAMISLHSQNAPFREQNKMNSNMSGVNTV